MNSNGLLKRRLRFAGLNGAIVLTIGILILGPLIAHFGERNDDILDNAAQLAQIQRVTNEAARLAKTTTADIDPYLPAAEERVASADLQASLQALASARGLVIQTIRGLPGRQAAQWRAIPVRLELEGASAGVRELISSVETQTPFLFITDFSLRSLGDGDDSRMRVSLTIEGALRNPGGPPTGPLLSENRPGEAARAASQ
ncbi:type II secretion system protein GspM [Bradyrhizobium sp. GCM10023182]|uniref:Type II secretion system protein GspM n=1 Tax=Bradyrhizobium zhengyangense TaxID=2911009 RepID=A0ABS9M0M4_9BRAD|nr:type II secretion system protein GspM [Bradyrhizobium zhengyangense]